MNDTPNGRLPFAHGETVVLVPMDGPPAGEIVQLLVDLRREGVHATLAEPVALPTAAYDRTRGQYRAERLLAAIRERDGGRVLGVTARDINAEGLKFAFGIADSPGRAAVICSSGCAPGPTRRRSAPVPSRRQCASSVTRSASIAARTRAA